MKKKIIATTMLLPLILALAGCNKEVSNPIDEKLDNTFLTPEILDKNISLMENKSNKISPKFFGYNSFNAESDKTIFREYLNDGIAILKDKITKKLSVYSFVHQKTILNKEFEPDTTISVIRSGYNQEDIAALNIHEGEQTLVVDLVGNILVDVPKVVYVNINTIIAEKNLYLVTSYDDEELEDKVISYYRYEDDSKLVKVKSIPETGNRIVDKDFIPKFEQGDLFKGNNIIPLDYFGHDGYYLNDSKSNFSIFNDKNEYVSTYSLNDLKCILGDKLIYQEKNETGYENKDFDFYENGNKYNYNIKIVDYMTGKESEIEPNFFIESMQQYCDENGIAKYAVADIKPIINKTVYDEDKKVILDENLNILQNITNINLFKMTKIGESYFDSYNNVLYDKNLKTIFKFDESTQIFPKLGLIKTFYNGRYVVIDSKGKVKIDNGYNNIELSESGKDAICFSNDIIDVIDLETFKIINTFTGYASYIYNDIWGIENKDNTYIVTLDGIVKNIDGIDFYSYIYEYKAYNDKNVTIICLNDGTTKHYFTFDLTDGKFQFNTY